MITIRPALCILILFQFLSWVRNDALAALVKVDTESVDEFQYQEYEDEYEMKASQNGTSVSATTLKLVLEPRDKLGNIISSGDEDDPIDEAEDPRYRAAYICLDAQRLLCLGISTENPPVWDPENLVRLQVERREKNEM